jgi:hypothetical protein
MSLRNLLNMDPRQILNLSQFQQGKDLQVVVHPSWSIYFGEDYNEHQSLQKVVNHLLDEVYEKATTLNEVSEHDFLYFNGHFIDWFKEKNNPKCKKTETYLEIVSSILEVYEYLSQQSHLISIRNSNQLCVLLLPKNFDQTHLSPNPFYEFLREITNEQLNFVYLETRDYDNGTIEENELEKLKEVYELLGLKKIHLFGGILGSCLYDARHSILKTGLKVNIILEVSEGNQLIMESTLKHPRAPYNLKNIPNFDKLSQKVDYLLKNPIDLSQIYSLKGLPFDEQLSGLKNYKSFIYTLNQIKKIVYKI